MVWQGNWIIAGFGGCFTQRRSLAAFYRMSCRLIGVSSSLFFLRESSDEIGLLSAHWEACCLEAFLEVSHR